MKFKLKPRRTDGEQISCERFAWIPTLMTDNKTVVWLEKYSEKKIWVSTPGTFGFGLGFWSTLRRDQVS